jgi:outer membrane autotransporter protein
MEKKSNFKKFLATASAFAVITGAATEASAIDRVTEDTAVTIDNNEVASTGKLSGAGNYANGETVKVHADAVTMTVSGTANTTVGEIDVNDTTGSGVVAADATTLNGVVNNVDGSTKTLYLVVNDGVTVTLNGTDFSGLGEITLGNATTDGANLVISESTTLSGVINSDIASKSTLTVDAGKTVVFEGAVGANSFLTTTLNGNATFESTLGSDDTAVAAKATFAGAVTGNIASDGTDAVVNIGTSSTAADLTGNLDMTNGGTAVVYGDVDGDVTAAHATNEITITGDVTGTLTVGTAGATATVTGNVGDVALDDGVKVTVTGDITGTTTLGNAGDVLTLGAGTSTDAVNNAGKIKVTGNRTFANANATANALGAVEVQDGDIDLTFSAVDGLATTVLTTLATDKSNNITISQSQTLAVGTEIGTSAKQFGNIKFSADKALTLGTDKVYAAITTATDTQGTVVFGVDDTSSVRSLGASGAVLKAVTFTKSATVAGGTYATGLTVAAGKTATLGGTVSVTNDLDIGAAAGSTLAFQDDAVVNATITNNGGNGGAVTFAGSAELNGPIGATGALLTSVTFDGTSKDLVKLATGSDIFATNIAINANAGVQLQDDITFEGATALDGGLIDVQDHTLTHTGNVTINGTNNALVLKVSANATTGALEGGQLAITGDLDYTTATDIINVELDDRGATRKQGTARTYIIATKTGGTVTADNFAVTRQKKLVKYAITIDGNDVIATEVDNGAEYMRQIRSGRGVKTMDNLYKAGSGTNGAKLLALLDTLTENDNDAKAIEALDRIEKGSVVAHNALIDPMTAVSGSIDTRINETSTAVASVNNSTVTGVAAGDDAARFGAWASPFYARVNQSERNGFSGYKNEAYGLTAGLDTKVNEDLVVGVSVSASHSNIKHKDTKSGDRTKVDTLLFSLYHTQSLTNNWFMSGNITFASNDVNNSAKRNTSTSYETATAKYTVTAFELKEMFGYNYAMSTATITPMIGAKYTRVNNASYTESGTTIQNLSIATKAFDKVEAIAGGRITGAAYDLGGSSLTPEAHAFVQYDLLNRTQKQSVALSGVDLDSATDKTARLKYNLGLSVNSQYGAMEYGAGYDLQLANKRVGHQGSLKVRVNF